MAIKAMMDTIDGLGPIDPKTAFKKDEKSGKWVLDVESVAGLVLEDVSDLKASLSGARAERDKLKSKVDAFGDLDPVAARAAQAKLTELGDLSKLTNEQKTQEAIANLRTQMEGKSAAEKASYEATIRGLEANLHDEMIVGGAARAMAGKVIHVRAMTPHIHSRLRTDVVEGKRVVRVIDERGNVAITRKQGSTEPMGIDELVDILGADPEFAPHYAGKGSSGGGTGNPAPAGSGGEGKVIKVSRSEAGRPGVLEGISKGTHVVVD